MPSVTLSPARSLVGAFTPELFATHLATQKGVPEGWLERKRAAFARFAELPLPRRTDEAWRFSNLTGLDLEGYVLPPPAFLEAGIGDLKTAQAASLVFANGALVQSASLAPELAARGVVVTTLSQALVRHGDLLRRHFLAQPQRLGSEKFAALHAAFLTDGAFIHIPRGVELEAPIVVLHAAAGEGAAVFPHTLVIAEENSRATVLDLFVSAGGSRQLAIGVNDLYAGHGARLTYVAAQRWSRQTLSFQLNSTVVRRDARVQSLNLHLGGRQARHESLSQLQAPGALSEMLALTVAQGVQEFDQRTLQIHQAPNTKSDLLYKNALFEKGRTIFSGLIIVDPDAQKTDAYQSNRNLLLSPDAEANSLPGLEIQANDVRCTHGATHGRIDEEQLFYLRARGIPTEVANELLVFGFFEEVLGRLENPALHDALRALLQAQFKP